MWITLFFLATADVVAGLISVYKHFTNKVFDVWPFISSKQRVKMCPRGIKCFTSKEVLVIFKSVE